MTAGLSRRAFLGGAGALVVGFTLPAPLRAQVGTPPAKAGLYSGVDAWLAVAPDGGVTLFTGKVELGTGVSTALAQLVAEELDVPVSRVTVVQGDTERTPDQGQTVGSKTLQVGGPPIRQAAAEARQALLALAGARLGAPPDRLTVNDGVVSVVGDASRRVTYADIVGGRRFNRTIGTAAAPKTPDRHRVVGVSVPRTDIPGKVTGRHRYLQDVRLPGMLHGRVVRPASVGAVLRRVDEASVARVPGLVKVVVRDNFVGVVAEREEQAIEAAHALKVEWTPGPALPDASSLHRRIREAKTTDRVLKSVGDVEAALAASAKTLHATYEWPLQMHASIGPSCAVADVRGAEATIWSASQGVFLLRDAIGQLLGLAPDKIRVVFVEAAGCYGHNGADDAAADAALLSQAAGKPVRVQWMRHDEHGWEPKGPAMVMEVRGGLDARGGVGAWDYGVWTPTHSTRPAGQAGNTLAGQLIGRTARNGFTGGDRNAQSTYVFPHQRVAVHWLDALPLRVSALRGLGGPQNTFANESFIDELAAAAGADPVEYRLRHLEDPRAVAVLEAAAKAAGWQAGPAGRRRTNGPIATGRGVAYAQYESKDAYVAMVADVEVTRATGAVRVTDVFVAHDCGQIVNPDGVRNQIEGNVIQTISRTLKEAVAFDRGGVTSLDWGSYPILTFPEVPERIEIVLIDRPHEPSLGAGEPAACPVPAAIANALFDATGARLRTVPFTADRVRAALDAARG
jgi:CO/xanthine dehydrogenase Mo-binding subunit